MTGFLDAARYLLQNDRTATELRLYFYAVTTAGWRELSADVATWKAVTADRTVTAYIGFDHALTDPKALEEMRDASVAIRLLRRYNGIYHPKVLWFVEAGAGHLLVGSNNLTLDGLKSNIEFATLTQLVAADVNLDNWHGAVHMASDPLTGDLLDGYGREREAFGKARAKAKVAGTFTWSKRSSGGTPPRIPVILPITARKKRRAAPKPIIIPAGPTALPNLGSPAIDDLILEIMPLETGTGGSQIQIPMQAAREFFRLRNGAYAQVAVSLRNVATGDQRNLTMTRFRNATARLVIRELDYRDRPCFVLFRRTGTRKFDFEIVRLAIDPDRYRLLLSRCGSPTRIGSRRWVHVPVAAVP
jgi:hypothetical protein